MSKKVDIDLIVAFIEGSLSNEKRKYVRERIDNDNDWFLEYMNLKEGEYQYKSYLGENTDTEEFSSNLLPNKNETIFAAFSAVTPFYSAALIGIISIGAFSIIYLDVISESLSRIFKNSGIQPAIERVVEKGELTQITYDKSTIVISSSHPENLNISIFEENENSSIPSSNTFFIKILSGTELIINKNDVYKFLSSDSLSNFPLKVVIYDSKENIKQTMLVP